MHSKIRSPRSFWTTILAVAAAWLTLPANATVFSNPAGINTPAQGAAALYPSPIAVSGLSGTISALTVSLNNVSHARPDDLEILLVSPSGSKFILISDVGGTTVPLSAATITFSDAAANLIPDAGPLTAGSWKPTCVNFQGDIQTAGHLPAPAPAPPYALPNSSQAGGTGGGTATLNSSFGGENPNGTWNLYVFDDFTGLAGESGSISGGWSLDITAAVSTLQTTTAVSSSANPSFTGTGVTFTATVTSSGNPVTLGSVTFQDGATLLSSVAVNASGQAVVTTSALTEGSHSISAVYSGATGFASSQGSLIQEVNTRTVVTGNQFCNPGGLNLSGNSPFTATAYPSRMFVSGLSGSISKVTVTLNDITIDRPDDIELLLVGPGGQSLVILGDSGGVNAVSLVDLVLDDSAANLVPDASVTSGTFRPTSYNSSVTTFPAPAPAGPWPHPAPSGSSTFASMFNGANPNGTWRLFALDDVGGTGGMIGSWCLTFITTSDVATTTTVTSSPNPSTTGQNVTFTAQVRRADNNAAVTAGSVVFREGNTVLGGPVALNGSGNAVFSTAALTAGTHTISADYSGSAGSFNTSTGVMSQQVDTATQVAGNQFCNPGVITVVQSGLLTADVYPSRILVQNAGGTITKVKVALNGISTDRPDDLDILLVGPGGEKMVLMADAGGINPVANVNLVLDDAAANALPDASISSGTFRPAAYLGASFPSPAPASPGLPSTLGTATLASVFTGANPNGYWSLYVVDDVGSAQASVITSWCLTLETTPGITCPSDFNINVAAGSCNSAPLTFTATGTGLPAPTITYTLGGNPITSPHAFPTGVNVVTATASNGSGTPATCTFKVTVVDNIDPVIACPANFVVNVAATATSGIANYPTPTVSDNCSAPVACVPASGSVFPLGMTTVHCTATDPAGRTATCSFTVTVNRGPLPMPDALGLIQGGTAKVAIAKILANDQDPEGQGLTLTAVQNPSPNGAAVAIAGGFVQYTPLPGFSGSDSFTYSVQDSQGGAADGLVKVTVTPANDQGGNLVSIILTPTTRIVRFAGIPGQEYQVQWASSVTGPWTPFAGSVIATPTGVVEYIDTENPPPPIRFYRTLPVIN